MADDLGTLYTDKKLQTLERKLKAEYRKAQKDIEEKTKIFFDKAAAKDKVMQSRLDAGKITQEEYDHWRQGKIFYGENWKAQQESIAKVLADTNKVATAMINGEKADVFAFNGNYTGYELEHGFGVNFGFDLYSEKSVERLLKDNPKLMPPKKLDKRKDIPWNMRNIRSQVTQGLIQGESIPKIAKRLSEVVPNRNEKQMVLHARTAMTGAQNGGRMERFKEAEALGIKFKKVWIATLDSRTRDRHADLDGQAVKPDEYFDSGKFRIMFPGDPNGEPSTVWNCRCTLGTKLDDYPRTFTRRVQEDGSIIAEQSYRQWEASKQNVERGEIKTTPRKETPKEQTVSEIRTAFKNSLNENEKRVIGKYQSQSFEFNQKLRSGIEWGEDQATESEYRAMDNALAKGLIEKDAIVYRGVSGDTEAFFALNKGDTLIDKGYCSTTYDKDMALMYGDEVLFEIKVQKGQPGAYISHIADADGNTFEDNQETLLPRGSDFEVVDIEDKEEKVNIMGTIVTSKRRIIKLIYRGVAG